MSKILFTWFMIDPKLKKGISKKKPKYPKPLLGFLVCNLTLTWKIRVLSLTGGQKTILCPERLRHFQGVWWVLPRIPKWVDKVKLARDTAQKYDFFGHIQSSGSQTFCWCYLFSIYKIFRMSRISTQCNYLFWKSRYLWCCVQSTWAEFWAILTPLPPMWTLLQNSCY